MRPVSLFTIFLWLVLKGCQENPPVQTDNINVEPGGVNVWEPVGPIFQIPDVPNVKSLALNGSLILAGTRFAGIFRSYDDGVSWSEVNAGLVNLDIGSLTFLDSDLLAGTREGIYRSTNNGDSWFHVNSGISDGDIPAIMVSGQNVFASCLFPLNSNPGIYRSNDGGESWVHLQEAPGSVYALAAKDSIIFAATAGRGVYRSTDNGNTWSQQNLGLTYLDLRSFAIEGETVFVGGVGGLIYRSDDNGISWNSTGPGLTSHAVSAMLVSGSDIYACTGWEGGDPRKPGGGDGIFLSTDLGSSWKRISEDLFSTDVTTLALSGTTLIAGTRTGGIFRSTNNGVSWSRPLSHPQVSPVSLLAFSGGTLYAKTNIVDGADAPGLYRSTDYGSSWAMVHSHLRVSALAANGTTVFIGVGGSIFRSTDEGTDWHEVASDLTNEDMLDIAVSGSRVLAFAGYETYGPRSHLRKGMVRSTDNGITWNDANTGIRWLPLSQVVLSPSGAFVGSLDGSIYGYDISTDSWVQMIAGLGPISCVEFTENKLFAGGTNGVYRSLDNGLSWGLINQGLPSGVGLLAAWDSILLAMTAQGVFRMSAGDTVWMDWNSGLPADVTDLTIGGPFGFASTVYGVWRRRTD